MKSSHKYILNPEEERPYRNVFSNGMACIRCGLNIGFDPKYGYLYSILKSSKDKKECWECKKELNENQN